MKGGAGMLEWSSMCPTNEEKHQEAYAASENEVRRLQPKAVAERCGMTWQPAGPSEEDRLAERRGMLTFEALGAPIALSWPELAFDAPHPLLRNFAWQLIALHYLRMATGRRPGTDWVSYRELPDGMFYANTITREVEEPLARLFAADPDGFRAAGRTLGGTSVDLADVALAFYPLPYVPVIFALWVEDEEFPAKLSVLYEREGTANLPLQDLRILADMLGAGLKGAADAGGGPSQKEGRAPDGKE